MLKVCNIVSRSKEWVNLFMDSIRRPLVLSAPLCGVYRRIGRHSPRTVLYTGLLSSSLFADSVLMPDMKNVDLSSIPPSATHMLREERKDREAESLDSVKKVVQEVVQAEKQKKKESKKKKGKKAKTVSALTASTVKDVLAQKQAQAQEVATLLYQQYQDTILMGKRVTLQLKQMPVKEAIALLSKVTDVVVIVDADVVGTVQPMRLEAVPLNAALRSILSSNNPPLALVKDLGVWRVMRLPAAQEMMVTVAARQREKDIQARSYTVAHTHWNDAFKQRLEKLWQGMIQADADKQNFYLVFDDVNKKLFVRGRSALLEEFMRFVYEIDVNVPQIRIDARVVSADKEFQDAIGFNWSGCYSRRASVHHVDFVGVGPITTPPDAKNPQPTDTQSYSLYKDLIGWSLNLFPEMIKPILKIPFVFGNNDLSTKRLNLSLQLAESRSEAKTISKPSVLVHNDETAEILVGQEFPQEVRLDETIESRLTNITTVNYKDVGMKIKVKPSVTADQSGIFLDVYVENSYITRSDVPPPPTPRSDPNATFNYTIRTSRSRSRVLLKSGQTTLIGGLIETRHEKEQSGVPYLQDIPVLGYLFKGTQKHIVDRELLIFINADHD